MKRRARYTVARERQAAGRRGRARRARELAVAFVEGYDAAPSERASAVALGLEQRAEAEVRGGRSFRVLGGYDGVVHWLRAGLSPGDEVLRLGAAVTEVRWGRGWVEVAARSPTGLPLAELSARAAVVTLPLGVLQAPQDAAGAVRFIPPLPAHVAAARQLGVGAVVRVALRFRRRFWAEDRLPTLREGDDLARLGFLYAAGQPFPWWWTTAPALAPLLAGWAGGPAAQALAGRGQAELLERALDSVAGAFGLSRASVEDLLETWHIYDWQTDPFARGAYSYVPVGGLAAQASLARPVEATLFFAGEATECHGHHATVHGAIATGRRAAAEVLASLG